MVDLSIVLPYSWIAFSMHASSSSHRSAIFIMSVIVGAIFVCRLSMLAFFFSISAAYAASMPRREDTGDGGSDVIGTIRLIVRWTRHSAGSDLSVFLPTAEYS